MSKCRSMYAGSSGSNYSVNKNSPGNGNGKWQGLPPITNMRSLLIPYINTRARGNNRNVVFCMNQLGGVGKRSNMFASNADGVKEPCHTKELTPCEKYVEALLDGDDGRPSLRSTLRGAQGRTDRSLLGGSFLNRYGGSTELTLLQDEAAEAARKEYPIRGSKNYKRTIYQGAVPPDARKKGDGTGEDTYIDYQKAMFQWAADDKISIDRVFFDLSSLDVYENQTIENLVKILKDVDPSIQVGVLNEAQPDYVFETNNPELQRTAGGLNPDPATWIPPVKDCSILLKDLVEAGTKKCIGAEGEKPICPKADPANDYANGDGSCKCTNGDDLLCWTKEICTQYDAEGNCKYPACENPLKGKGCPNQLQVSYRFIAEVNKALQAQGSAGGYITCVIADKENGAYAENILLSLACAHTILRPSLPDRLQKCMEVGLAGQGSMTPGGIVVSSLLFCCNNNMNPAPGESATNPTGATTIEGMFLSEDKGGGRRALRAPYNDILITTYPELYWYMNDLKPLGCVSCDHTMTDGLTAKSSAECFDGRFGITNAHALFDKYNKYFDHTIMVPKEGDDLYAQCLEDAKAGNFGKGDGVNADQLCKCLACVSCKYSNPNPGEGDKSVAPGNSPGSAPNMNIPYQRYGPYGQNDPAAFAKEIWYTTDDDPDPYKARIGTTRNLFTSNLYGMRAMFSNEISHNWGDPNSELRIDGRENNQYSCIARRMGSDTCGTFDGFSNWSWEKFSEFLDQFSGQPAGDGRSGLQELAIYEWQFVPPHWLKGTDAEHTMAPYVG